MPKVTCPRGHDIRMLGTQPYCLECDSPRDTMVPMYVPRDKNRTPHMEYRPRVQRVTGRFWGVRDLITGTPGTRDFDDIPVPIANGFDDTCEACLGDAREVLASVREVVFPKCKIPNCEACTRRVSGWSSAIPTANEHIRVNHGEGSHATRPNGRARLRTAGCAKHAKRGLRAFVDCGDGTQVPDVESLPVAYRHESPVQSLANVPNVPNVSDVLTGSTWRVLDVAGTVLATFPATRKGRDMARAFVHQSRPRILTYSRGDSTVGEPEREYLQAMQAVNVERKDSRSKYMIRTHGDSKPVATYDAQSGALLHESHDDGCSCRACQETRARELELLT